MAEKRTDTAPGAAPQAARPTPHPQPADNRPVRRVGSITLGLCLVALGICFLCYYFLPGFNWTLVVKVGGDLCRDAGESALAAVVETAGAVCALLTALPLLRAVLSLLWEFIA